MIFHRIIAVVAVAALAGCGGGGGGGTPPETTPAPPETTPAPDPKAGRGVATAAGIDRIPLDAVKATNRQMAAMYAIVEYKGFPTEPGAHSPPGVRRTPHSDAVRGVACHSYIRACEDPFGPNAPFQFHLGVRYPTGQLVPPEEQQNGSQQIEKILRDLPATVKIVSASYGGATPAALLGADLSFAAIESAGNEDRDTFLDTSTPEDEGVRNMRAAVAAGKALFVAGYDAEAEEGVYERGGSVGCVGVGFSDGCIWAPDRISYPLDADQRAIFEGTSASAPHVASALASVLAVFPETSPWELIRLAKACAIKTPSLPGGVGRADFACMTAMGDDGQWQLVSADEFAGLIAPAAMNRLAFPGDARVAGTFVVGRSGKSATLATYVPGSFSFSAGVPALSPERQETGFFPVYAGDNEDPVLGAGFMTDSGMFVAAAMGDRDAFFGLGAERGYSGARSVDAALGHRNAYVRFSRQWSSAAPLVTRIEGDAVGVTAERSFSVSPKTLMTLSGHIDRFVGGRADTVFGLVSIDGTRWNRSAEASFDHSFSEAEALTVTADKRWLAHGGDAGISVGYRLRF